MGYMDLNWAESYTGSGTTYIDEPSETVPVGWYVIGHDPNSDDPETQQRVVVFVQSAVDEETGNDVTGDVASTIANLLNEAGA